MTVDTGINLVVLAFTCAGSVAGVGFALYNKMSTRVDGTEQRLAARINGVEIAVTEVRGELRRLNGTVADHERALRGTGVEHFYQPPGPGATKEEIAAAVREAVRDAIASEGD